MCLSHVSFKKTAEVVDWSCCCFQAHFEVFSGTAAHPWKKKLRLNPQVIVWWLPVIIKNSKRAALFCFQYTLFLGLLTLLRLLTDAHGDTWQRVTLSPLFDSEIYFSLITSKPQSTQVKSERFLNLLSHIYSPSFILNRRNQAKATPGRQELSLLLSRVSLIVSFLFHISWSPWKHYESKHQMFPGITVISSTNVPKFERVLERSMMACLLGLFRTERLAREMSAVTRVIDILTKGARKILC